MPRLLDALPHVSVVVLCGNVARSLTIDVYDYGADHDRDLLVLHGPHPSRRGLQGNSWFSRGQRTRWLRRVIEQARDHTARHGEEEDET